MYSIKRGRRRCLITSCRNQERYVSSLHEFPSNTSIRNKWFEKIGLLKEQQENLPDQAVICNIHFSKDCFRSTSRRKMLKREAFPTLFLNNPRSPQDTPETSNFHIPIPSILEHVELDNCSSNQIKSNYSSPTNPVLPNILSSSPTSSLETAFTVADKSSQVDFIKPEEIQKYKYDIKLLKLKIKRLTEKEMALTDQLREANESINNASYKTLLQIKNDSENNNTYAIFLLDQITNDGKQKPRFSELNIRNCIMWRYRSPKGYEYCRSTVLKLPSRSSIQRYLGNGRNISDLITSRLVAEASCLKPAERMCSLIIDDMSIREKLNYNRTEDRMYGFENIRVQTGDKKNIKLANKMLCYIIHGLSTKFIISVAYFFHRTMTTTEFYNITLNVLKKVRNCGFVVLRIVTDNHRSNTGLFKALGNNQLLTRVEHPVESKIPLFLSFDYCHLIKNARNIFIDHDMQSKEGIISSKYIKHLYQIQKKMIVKPVRFLTEKHLYPSNFEKMNVRRAVEIFSPPVTAAIKYLSQHQTSIYDFSNSNGTTTFMETMYSFFQMHDVSDRIQYITQKNNTCAPDVDINYERLLWLNTTFPNYINIIQEESKKHKLKGLTKETAEALKFTAKSTTEVIQYLLKEAKFYYVLTRSFSSDAIEAMFSSVRMKGGSLDATDARAAHYAIQNILQCGLIKATTSENISNDMLP